MFCFLHLLKEGPESNEKTLQVLMPNSDLLTILKQIDITLTSSFKSEPFMIYTINLANQPKVVLTRKKADKEVKTARFTMDADEIIQDFALRILKGQQNIGWRLYPPLCH